MKTDGHLQTMGIIRRDSIEQQQLQIQVTFDIMKDVWSVWPMSSVYVDIVGEGMRDDWLTWNAGVIPNIQVFVRDPLHRSSNLLSLVITYIPGLYMLICHSGR